MTQTTQFIAGLEAAAGICKQRSEFNKVNGRIPESVEAEECQLAILIKIEPESQPQGVPAQSKVV